MTIATFAKRVLVRNLGRRGYRIVRVGSRVMHCTASSGDALGAWYAAGGLPFVVEVSLRCCRIGASGFRCEATSDYPFIRLMRDYRLGKVTKDDYDAIQAYFPPELPRNAAESLELSEAEVHEGLLSTPATDCIYPWDNWSVETEKQRWSRGLQLDLQTHLHLVSRDDVASAVECNIPLWNLVEFRRSIAVYESIQRMGYRRSDDADGDISGTVLVWNNESVLVVYRGYHRMAALAALGYDRAPIRVGGASGRQSVVRREEADYWPKVREGLFTRQQALCVFDRIFHGR